MKIWNTAVYLRLSSDDGDKAESNSIVNQREMINYYLKKNKDLKLKKYYIDDGYTGTDFDRPGFQEMLDDIHNGKINAIVVKDLSRFGRNHIMVGNYLEQVFPSYNIRFIAINDNLDSFKNPETFTNIIVPFKNLLNDEYARDISNKVKSVFNSKKMRGEFLGISAPYGYLKDTNDCHKFIIDKKTYKIVKKIFKMAQEGKSRKEIAIELNNANIPTPSVYKMNERIANYKKTDEMEIWDQKTVNRILKNQSYIGDLVQGKRRMVSHKVHKLLHVDEEEWIIVPEHHKPIITKEEYEFVQNNIYNRETRTRSNDKVDLFSGHLKCADCGKSLTIVKAKNKEYFYCQSYTKRKECTKHSINKEKLTKIVLKLLNKQIELVMDINDDIKKILINKNIDYDYEIINGRKNDLEDEINKIKMLKDSIKEDLKMGIITKSEFKEYEKEYNDNIDKRIEEKIKYEEMLSKKLCNSKNNIDWIKKFENYQPIQKLTKKAVDELIDNILLYEDGTIKIIFNYEEKYFEALDFINQHKCDIIRADVNT